LDFNEYQRLAMRTISDVSKDNMVLNGVMGLCGEAGECIDVVKKHMFQGHTLDREKLIDEASDCLWYLAEMAEGLGIPLSEIAAHNIEKLRKRYPNGFEVKKSIRRVDNDVMEWLTGGDNPALRYRTLVDICGKSPEDGRDAYDAIWAHKPVARMFSKQDENGLWDNNSYEYVSACAELGLQADERLMRYVDFIVKDMTEYIDKTEDAGSCKFLLMLRALVMMGYHERDDVKALLARVAAAQLFDGGYTCQRLLKKKPGRKSCYKAAVQGLLLYAECKRKGILPDNADALVDYFIKRKVFYASNGAARFMEGRAGWRFIDNFFPAESIRVGLPLIMYALSVLGAGNHPALTEAWALLKAKQNADGRLTLEGTLSKFPYNFGKVGTENKWMTFYAVLAEKYRAG
jgi:NTP pyrophosphatase (non-canonical NTP hydrolase)